MKTVFRIFIVFLTYFGITSAPASAHHGWGGYNIDMDMMATVTESHWENPHDRLIVTDTNGEIWNLLLAPPIRNRRFGFGEDTVSVGDEIRLIGQRHAEKREAKVHLIYSGSEQIYEYLYSANRSSLDRFGKTASDVANAPITDTASGKVNDENPKQNRASTPIVVWVASAALLLFGFLLAYAKRAKRKGPKA